MNILYVSRDDLYKSPGGDTVQLESTKKYVMSQDYSVNIDVVHFGDIGDYSAYDIIHVFNIMLPYEALFFLSSSKFSANVKFVISPIYVDYSNFELKNRLSKFRKLLILNKDKHFVEKLKFLAKIFLGKKKHLKAEFYFRSFSSCVCELIKFADVLLPNSQSEMNRIRADFPCSERSPYKIIDNAVDLGLFYGYRLENSKNSIPKEGVIVAGRIEQRKNQLNVIKALNELGVPAIIVGSSALNQKKYYNDCINAANDNIKFLGQVSQSELSQLFLSSKVSILASWFETTGLVSLEAAACGCNIVITRMGDTEEYFEDSAFYCLPDDVMSIKKAISDAYKSDFLGGTLVEKISKRYTWPIVGNKTYEIYKNLLGYNK